MKEYGVVRKEKNERAGGDVVKGKSKVVPVLNELSTTP
jgi:hypothetical protein